MERRVKPLSRARIGALALFVVAASAACGTGPVGRSAAATVDGREISADQVENLLEAQKRYLKAEKAKPDAPTDQVDAALQELLGEGADTFSTSGASQAVSSWINFELINAELARKGENVTDADRSSARSALEQQVGGADALEKLDKDLIDFSVDSAAAYTAITRVAEAEKAKTTGDRDGELRKLHEAQRTTTPLCLRMILTADEDASNAARERIEGGEDFEAVASEVSTDQSTAANGGFLGCADADRAAESFGADFSSVAVGDLVGPIVQPDGVLLLQVASLDGTTFDQARPQLEQQLAQSEGDPTEAYVRSLWEKAKVTVDPRYGTWDPSTGQVTPPVAAGSTPTSAVASIEPASGS